MATDGILMFLWWFFRFI